MTDDRRIISRQELAHRLGVSERTIFRMERSGHLPTALRIGVKRRGHWSDVRLAEKPLVRQARQTRGVAREPAP
jgi:predicted DNA-binding transcriptional regulator AlpA